MTTVAELRDLLAKATPGPWELYDKKTEIGVLVVSQPKENGKRDKLALFPGATDRDWQRAHAAFIVAAVNALPALLDGWEAAKAISDGWFGNGFDPARFHDLKRALEKLP